MKDFNIIYYVTVLFMTVAISIHAYLYIKEKRGIKE